MFSIGSSTNNTVRSKIWGKSTSGAGAYLLISDNDAGSILTLLSAGVPTIVPQLLEFRASATQGWIRVNGGTEDPAAAAFACGTLTANRSAIGMRPDSVPDDFYDGKISEILIYNTELADPDPSLLRQYLGTKWGIAVTP
jgi:hypothetical protein